MDHAPITRTSVTMLAALSLGLAGIASAQSSSTPMAEVDGPTRSGAEKSPGISAPGSSGNGAASGSGGATPPQGSTLGGSTGDKGFSNVRENKGGRGSMGTMGGSTESKAGHAGESIGSGGTGKGNESNLDAAAPADGSSPGFAK